MSGPAFPLVLALALLFFLLGPLGASTARGAWSAVLLTLSWAIAAAFLVLFVRRAAKDARGKDERDR